MFWYWLDWLILVSDFDKLSDETQDLWIQTPHTIGELKDMEWR